MYDKEGKPVGSVPVPKELEGSANAAVLWQAVRMYLANQRQGTADTKRRGEVRGGGRKPWKQKHTGRARAGSIRSPLWRKGGIVFGPHPREYRYELPPQVKRLALVNSLRNKVSAQSVAVVESLDGLTPKTKALADLLRRLEVGKGALLVVEQPSPILWRIARNLRRVEVRPVAELNAYEVLETPKLVVTSEAWKKLEAVVRESGRQVAG